MYTNGIVSVLLLLIPLCMSLYLGILALQRRHFRGALSFALMMFVMGWWCLSALAVVISRDDETARWWLRSMFAVSAYLPVFTLFATMQVVGQGQRPTFRSLAPFLIVPTITAVLSITSAYNTLHYHHFHFIRSAGGEVVAITDENGVWAFIHLFYSYAVAGYSIYLLTRQWMIIQVRTFRVRLMLLTVGLLIPLAASAINTLLLDQHTFITPMSFIIVVPLLYWAFSHYRLFDLTPIAREQAFEQMSEAVIIADAEGRVVDVNPSAARLAQTSKLLIGQPLDNAFPAFAAGGSTTAQRLNALGERVMRYYDSRVSPISRDGQPAGKLFLVRDVTEQHQALEQLRRTEIESERVRTVSAFIEAISHEIRTPLTTIKTATYMINRVDDKDKLHEKTTQIDHQVEVISQLVDSLLMVVRLRPDVIETFTPQDMNTLAQRASTPLKTEFDARSVHLETSFAPNLPPVNGSEDYLQDAIYAVLHNALRYTPAGGIVSLSTLSQDGDVILRIADTGIGIASEHLPHIFDLFYRADKARSTAGFGTGLAVANRVMELHGGTISASSTLGKGSTFVMTLPVLQA